MTHVKKRRRPIHWGTLLFIAAGVGLLCFGIFKLASVLHLQLEWNQFQVQYAACVYDVGMEDGYLKATSETEVVRVCQDNAVNVFRMMQTANAVSIGKGKHLQQQIQLEFSDGGRAVLSETDEGQVHVDFTNPGGTRWQFYLGKCDFSKIKTLLSVRGAAYENAAWVD